MRKRLSRGGQIWIDRVRPEDRDEFALEDPREFNTKYTKNSSTVEDKIGKRRLKAGQMKLKRYQDLDEFISFQDKEDEDFDSLLGKEFPFGANYKNYMKQKKVV
jgi:hypothetical protein